MDFVALLKFHSHLSAAEADKALARRATWRFPEGVNVIAEYWPASSAVQVVIILNAESVEKIMEAIFEWSDAFQIDIYPAISRDDGLRAAQDIFTRLPRLKQGASA